MSASTRIAATVDDRLEGDPTLGPPVIVINGVVGQPVVIISEADEDSPTWGKLFRVFSEKNESLWRELRKARQEAASWKAKAEEEACTECARRAAAVEALRAETTEVLLAEGREEAERQLERNLSNLAAAEARLQASGYRSVGEARDFGIGGR